MHIRALILLALLAWPFAAAAQSGVTLQEGTTTLGRATTIRCGTNLNCSLLGSVGVLDATGGAGSGSPGGSSGDLQINDGAGGFAGFAGASCPGQYVRTLSSTGAPSCVDAVSSITGTANQIARDVATGAVTLSLPAVLVAPGTLAVTTRTGTVDKFAAFDSSGKLISGSAYASSLSVNGTTNQVDTTSASISLGGSSTLSLSSTLVAPGSVSVTTRTGTVDRFAAFDTTGKLVSGSAYASSLTVNGTASQIDTNSASVSLGGSATLSIPTTFVMPGAAYVTTRTGSASKFAAFSATGQLVSASDFASSLTVNGTANQIDTTSASVNLGGSSTLSLSSTMVAPGTVSVTTRQGAPSKFATFTSGGQLVIGWDYASQITVNSTANQTSVSGSPVALGGTLTVGTVQDIGTGSRPTFSSLILTNNTNQLVLGTTNTTSVTMASLTGSRIFTLPDADSNPVRPSSCGAGDFVNTVSSAGVLGCGTPSSGTGNVHASATLTNNQLVVGHGTTEVATFADGSGVLHGGTPPTWASVSLTNDVSGQLPLVNLAASTITVNGTASQISTNSASITLGGTATLSLPSSLVAPGALYVTTRTGTPTAWATFSDTGQLVSVASFASSLTVNGTASQISTNSAAIALGGSATLSIPSTFVMPGAAYVTTRTGTPNSWATFSATGQLVDVAGFASSLTVNGTSNQINTTSASIALGGSSTLSLSSTLIAPGSVKVTTRSGTPAKFALFDSTGLLAENANALNDGSTITLGAAGGGLTMQSGGYTTLVASDTLAYGGTPNARDIVIYSSDSGSSHKALFQLSAAAQTSTFYQSNAGGTALAQVQVVQSGAESYVTLSGAGSGLTTTLKVASSLDATTQTNVTLTNGSLFATTASFANTNFTSAAPNWQSSSIYTTTLGNGIGSVRMSSGNSAANSAWIQVKLGGTTYYVPAWTTNAP